MTYRKRLIEVALPREAINSESATDLAAVALALNTRPRKTLDWRTPAEALDDALRFAHTSAVATTG